MSILGRASVVGLLILSTASAIHSRRTLKAAEESVITSWINRHPGYRGATARDCSCGEDIRKVRTGEDGEAPVRDYEPHWVAGDFSRDNVDDVAVVLPDTRKQSDAFALLIFNLNPAVWSLPDRSKGLLP